MSTTPTPAEDQGRLLEEALGVVRQQSHMMRKCLETPGKLMDALKCAYVLGSEDAQAAAFNYLTIQTNFTDTFN